MLVELFRLFDPNLCILSYLEKLRGISPPKSASLAYSLYIRGKFSPYEVPESLYEVQNVPLLYFKRDPAIVLAGPLGFGPDAEVPVQMIL
jgi:hypothetical protein